MKRLNPLVPFLERNDAVILDGALATELEQRGADLVDPLWSAKTLIERPELIRQVHYDYFVAGADVATTATYQATPQGFARRGLSAGETGELLNLGIRLALEARDDFWAVAANRRDRLRPLVAASIGPYGAYLADGSEYSGDYGLERSALIEFHRQRFAVLADSEADLLACETIPTLIEAEALVALLDKHPQAVGWLSFSCGDGTRLHHGETLAEAATLAAACDQVLAVGVNCTAPRLITSLLLSAGGVTAKPLVVYPNSGEGWDAVHRCWLPGADRRPLQDYVREWFGAGARLIGGCCRTTPEDIRQIRLALLRSAETARP